MNKYLVKIAEEAEKKSTLGRNLAIGGGVLLGGGMLAAALSHGRNASTVKGVAESVESIKRAQPLGASIGIRESQRMHQNAVNEATRVFNEQNRIFQQQAQINHAIHQQHHHNMF